MNDEHRIEAAPSGIERLDRAFDIGFGRGRIAECGSERAQAGLGHVAGFARGGDIVTVETEPHRSW